MSILISNCYELFLHPFHTDSFEIHKKRQLSLFIYCSNMHRGTCCIKTMDHMQQVPLKKSGAILNGQWAGKINANSMSTWYKIQTMFTYQFVKLALVDTPHLMVKGFAAGLQRGSCTTRSSTKSVARCSISNTWFAFKCQIDTSISISHDWIRWVQMSSISRSDSFSANQCWKSWMCFPAAHTNRCLQLCTLNRSLSTPN